MGSAPFGVQCPLTSSLGEFLGWLWYPGLPPVLVSNAFPFAFPYLGVFPFPLLHLPFNFIRVSSLRLMYLQPSVDPSLTHFLGEFQARDWLWYPMLWSQRRSRGAHEAEISYQISALAGI